MRLLIGVLSTLTLLLSSCSGYSDKELEQFDQEISTYLSEKKLTAERTDTGLYYTIIEEGDGPEIPYDAIISVNYKGYLTNGRAFDTQLGEPVELQLKRLVKGWREAMLYMNVGTKAQLFIPPHLGYQTQEKEDIPPNSVLIFDIHILALK